MSLSAGGAKALPAGSAEGLRWGGATPPRAHADPPTREPASRGSRTGFEALEEQPEDDDVDDEATEPVREIALARRRAPEHLHRPEARHDSTHELPGGVEKIGRDRQHVDEVDDLDERKARDLVLGERGEEERRDRSRQR